MSDCIFCKIIKGEIPCTKIYEDQHTLVFLDIAPVNKGHVLIVPKKHCEDMLDADPAMLGKLMQVSQRIGNALLKGISAQGFNLQVNNKRAAGQAVFHLHIHLVPRFADDGLQLWPSKKYTEGEMETFKEKILKCL